MEIPSEILFELLNKQKESKRAGGIVDRDWDKEHKRLEFQVYEHRLKNKKYNDNLTLANRAATSVIFVIALSIYLCSGLFRDIITGLICAVCLKPETALAALTSMCASVSSIVFFVKKYNNK